MGDQRSTPRPQNGPRRVVIEAVQPEIDSGRFPIKRIVGDRVVVEADIFADGHDELSCVLLHRKEGTHAWTETPMEPIGNDRWRASFTVHEIGRYHYTIAAWVDRFKSWRTDLAKRVQAGQDIASDLLAGAPILEEASNRASPADRDLLRQWARVLRTSPPSDPTAALAIAFSERLARVIARYPDRRFASTYDRRLSVVVDRPRARFSSWYELFPRSCSPEPGRHGTLRDCEARIPYVAAMGFDVLYLPPIHPIGLTNRKGPNNAPTATPGDPGSPWAIGSPDGGHTAIHPQLGTLDDFRALLERARQYDIEIALDLAFHASPDHPYTAQHPEWFRRRPDGSIQCAENPPKRYEDVYPFDFESDAWLDLWHELENIVRFWIQQGVRIFRVDNPHTKPFPFWEWLIDTIKRDHPDVIFLAEAFTRPKVMYRLAKLGFSQSYTYFAWRNTKAELIAYMTELTQTPVREFFRPNFWPNTPDILTAFLQTGGRPAFMLRLVLAATLASNYGIYGPAFELLEATPREPGSEEYLDSEKYQIRHWDLSRPDSLRDFIARVNRIRRESPALQRNDNLRFYRIDNDQLIAYAKHTDDLSDIILTVVNLDPHHTQSGWVEVPIHDLGIAPDQPFQVHDLLTDARYLWHGPWNYIELNPHAIPAHIFRVIRDLRTEKNFEYYM